MNKTEDGVMQNIKDGEVYNAYYDNIPLTDRILQIIGFKKEASSFATRLDCFTLDYPEDKRHFSLDNSFGYRWTQDSMNGHHHKYVLWDVGDLRKKHYEIMGRELDISKLKVVFGEYYCDPKKLK